MTPLDREFLGVAFNFHKGKHDFCPRLSDCRSHYAHLNWGRQGSTYKVER